MGGRRQEAAAATDRACPRCSYPREASQEFCVECGLRLPVVAGTVPALRRRWLLRLGWYPGDWVWLSIGTFAVAVAGAAASIAFTSRSASGGVVAATVVAATPRHAKEASPAVEHNGRVEWPAGQDGWTVVLVSSPADRGRKTPRAIAGRAVRDGLPQVGIIDSSGYSSLHPGYFVVFSGIYGAAADAETALQTVRARGFGGAYPRQISP
jgi:hypothetical protein